MSYIAHLKIYTLAKKTKNWRGYPGKSIMTNGNYVVYQKKMVGKRFYHNIMESQCNMPKPYINFTLPGRQKVLIEYIGEPKQCAKAAQKQYLPHTNHKSPIYIFYRKSERVACNTSH